MFTLHVSLNDIFIYPYLVFEVSSSFINKGCVTAYRVIANSNEVTQTEQTN